MLETLICNFKSENMSSYLNIYLQEKGSEKKILLTSYSRSTDIYQTFRETINPAYIGMEGEPKYSELTKQDLSYIINDIDGDLKKVNDRLSFIDKVIASNPDLINEALEWKEHKEDLEYTRSQIVFYKDLLSDMELETSGFSKMYCNID